MAPPTQEAVEKRGAHLKIKKGEEGYVERKKKE